MHSNRPALNSVWWLARSCAARCAAHDPKPQSKQLAQSECSLVAGAQLRGALRGAAAPVMLAPLVKDLDSGGGGGISLATALPLIEELAAEGAVRGQLKAGGAAWTPEAHARAQRAAVATFYAQAGPG